VILRGTGALILKICVTKIYSQRQKCSVMRAPIQVLVLLWFLSNWQIHLSGFAVIKFLLFLSCIFSKSVLLYLLESLIIPTCLPVLFIDTTISFNQRKWLLKFSRDSEYFLEILSNKFCTILTTELVWSPDQPGSRSKN